MYVHESNGHAMQYGGVIAFLVKITFWPQWPQMTLNKNFEP